MLLRICGILHQPSALSWIRRSFPSFVHLVRPRHTIPKRWVHWWPRHTTIPGSLEKMKRTASFLSICPNLSQRLLLVSHWFFFTEARWKEKEWEVLERLWRGSRTLDVHRCPRQSTVKALTNVIMSEEAKKVTETYFFVVVGPVGCGKSWLIRKWCNAEPW